MKGLIDRLRKVDDAACLSIIFNTHRTSPESQQDIIKLKNLVREAERRLRAEFPSKADQVLARLDMLLETIDHLYNLDSMAIFANSEMAEMVRMEVPVKDRVEVGTRFVLRDVLQSMSESTAYYVLVISRRQARLFEAYNDLVVKEDVQNFPIVNEIVEIDPHRLTMAAGTDNLIENFFKQVDNEVEKVINNRPLPLVIVTEERNFYHYEKITAVGDYIIGHLPRNRDDEEARLIAHDSWPLVHEKLLESHQSRIEDLRRATSAGNVMTDLNDISRALSEGRGRTLFVRNGLYQPGVRLEDRIEIAGESGERLRVDVLDELIASSVDHGGDVVFVDNEALDEFDGVALLTRY